MGYRVDREPGTHTQAPRQPASKRGRLVSPTEATSPLRLMTVRARTVLVIAAAAALLTTNVIAGYSMRAVDEPVLGWMIDHRSETLTPTMRTISDLGGGLAMTLFAVAVSGALVVSGHRLPALFVAAAGLGGSLLSYTGKQLVGRARPPAADHLVMVSNPAFPSGHSLGSCAVVGAVAIVAVALLRRRAAKLAAAAAASLFVLAVGLSRLYLGVHWATDVLGGWLLGGLWLGICLVAYRAFARRRIPTAST